MKTRKGDLDKNGYPGGQKKAILVGRRLVITTISKKVGVIIMHGSWKVLVEVSLKHMEAIRIWGL